MYIRTVNLENVRGFAELDFPLEQGAAGKYAGWTVIVGDNGSGKSAFLKAIALCLVGPDVARSLEESMAGWIQQGEQQAVLRVQLVADREADRYQEAGAPYKKPFWAELEITTERNGRSAFPILRPARGENLRQKGGRGPTRGPWAGSPGGWFCAGYGPFRRLYGSSSDAARLAAAPGPTGRFVTMFHEDADLSEAEIWLKDLEFRKKSGDSNAGEVADAVKAMLNDEFLHQGLSVDKVDPDGVWLRHSSGVVLPMRDMSDGYRAALALLVDIVRHMEAVYGIHGLIAEGEAGRHVTKPGVILIDEVDAHLHPEWQRNIGLWLKRHFPHVQFIVTTHSPLIAQAADERMIFHLPAPGSDEHPFQLSEQDYETVIRSKPDRILLTPAFGLTHTRSPRAVAAREEHARLSAKKSVAKLSPQEQDQLTLALRFIEDEEEWD